MAVPLSGMLLFALKVKLKATEVADKSRITFSSRTLIFRLVGVLIYWPACDISLTALEKTTDNGSDISFVSISTPMASNIEE